jgi:hypothetical protein
VKHFRIVLNGQTIAHVKGENIAFGKRAKPAGRLDDTEMVLDPTMLKGMTPEGRTLWVCMTVKNVTIEEEQ